VAYDFTPEEQMMIAHCQSMPVPLCDEYADLPLEVIDEAMTASCVHMPGMPGCEEVAE